MYWLVLSCQCVFVWWIAASKGTSVKRTLNSLIKVTRCLEAKQPCWGCSRKALLLEDRIYARLKQNSLAGGFKALAEILKIDRCSCCFQIHVWLREGNGKLLLETGGAWKSRRKKLVQWLPKHTEKLDYCLLSFCLHTKLSPTGASELET